MIVNRNTRGITATTYVQMMPHTTAVNTGLFFGITGRVIPTPSACTSGSQAIGYAWEAIRHGYQDVMVAGGAEGALPLRGRGLRHALCRQHPQRRARAHAASLRRQP